MMNRIFFREELAFLNDTVIYLETRYSEPINAFIRKNYSAIQKILAQKGITFIYLPIAFELPASDHFLIDYISYYYPGNSTEFIPDFISLQDQIAAKNRYSFFTDILRQHNLTGCGLLHKRVSKTYEDSYGFYWISLDENKDLKEQLVAFLNYSAYDDGPSIQALGGWELDDDTADSHFETDANALTEDVIRKIEYLKSQKEYAFLAEIALRMFDGNHLDIKDHIEQSDKIIEIKTTITPTISRLRIEWKSKYDFDIILPDYGNIVVDMPRLPKALYYFFLQHPEGIMLNSLCEYENELLFIYRRISNKTDDIEIIQNVERLTDPLDNSVNVNCSRIKSAFVRLIDNELAKNYYITGRRGSSKGIKLSPQLIEIKK